MKKILLLHCAIFLFASSLIAKDSPIQQLMEKYADQKGVTTVVISKDMLKLLEGFSQEEDSKVMSESIANIHGLTILKYSAESDKNNITDKIYNDIMKTIPINKYNEIMSIRKNGKKVSLLQREEGGIANMLLIVNEVDEVILISLDGNINVDSFSKIAKSLNVDALSGAEKEGSKKKSK